MLKNSLARRAVAGHAVRGGVGQHGRPADLRFLRGRGRRGEGRFDFAKTNDKLIVKAGAHAGKALDAKGVQSLRLDPVEGSAAARSCSA